MKKWSNSVIQTYTLSEVESWSTNNLNVEEISDDLCDGCVYFTTYHDGTLIFLKEAIIKAINQIDVTHTKQIGNITVLSDFIFCDMRYGNNQRAERDLIKIPFKYEIELDK
jgi:hypothetical protein